MVQRPSDRLADRRSEARFEIFGDLWATLVTGYHLHLVNLGVGGVLVESTSPLAVGSTHRARLRIGDRVAEIATLVKHVRLLPGNGMGRYLIGLAFMDLPADVRERIEELTGRPPLTAAGLSDVEGL